jgi:hypothetical protein
MEKIQSIMLIVGMFLTSIYSINISQQTIKQIENMNNQIHMMFLKS